jgi:negative regulator of flagellin synthesis FlgM
MDVRITGAYGVYKAQPVKKVTSATPLKGASKTGSIDSVSFSAVANELNVARKALREVPDIRDNIVAELREQLNAGTYNVSASDIAARIFGAMKENPNA